MKSQGKNLLWSITLFFLSISMPGMLHGDVFSLWPFSGKGSLHSDNLAILEGVDLWTEDITLNGRNMEMQITLIERPLQVILAGLKKRYKNFSALAGNSNSLLFEVPRKSGIRKRYYLVAVSGMQSMLLFSMDLPRNFKPGNSSALWPSGLILPPGAKPGNVMKFSKRNAVYGQFDSPYSALQVISQINTQLKNSRWKAVADENSRFASGGVFLRDDGKEIIIFSVRDYPASSGKNGCAGTLYSKKL